MCFLYRQFIELALKQLIIAGELFYRKAELLGSDRRRLLTFSSEKLNETHSIESLLRLLVSVLDCITEEVFDPEIEALIIEYHNMDPSGQRFRYPVSTKDIPSFYGSTFYDLTVLKKRMKKVVDYFSGIDGCIDY